MFAINHFVNAHLHKLVCKNDVYVTQLTSKCFKILDLKDTSRLICKFTYYGVFPMTFGRNYGIARRLMHE